MKINKFLFFNTRRYFTSITKDEIKEAIKNRSAKIIDVRETHELKEGFVPSAENIPLSSLAKGLENLLHREKDDDLRNKQVIFYCRAGVRSEKACKIAESMGFKR
jgi:rhodanese-related sulfurtransferase